MRCRVSRAEASPRPSMSKRGSPGRSSTSMLRERASIPQGAADRLVRSSRDSSKVGGGKFGARLFSQYRGSRRIPCTRRERPTPPWAGTATANGSWLVSIGPGATSGSVSTASGIEAESPQASLRARRLERRARPAKRGDVQKLRLTEPSTAPEIGAGPEEFSKDPLLNLRRRSPLSRLPSPSACLDYSPVGARALFQRRSTGKVG
jgi:hypothetical protein